MNNIPTGFRVTKIKLPRTVSIVNIKSNKPFDITLINGDKEVNLTVKAINFYKVSITALRSTKKHYTITLDYSCNSHITDDELCINYWTNN